MSLLTSLWATTKPMHVQPSTGSVYEEVRNDIIIGTKYADELLGNGGSDEIYGLNGNDNLNGAGGTDKIDGGNGHDAIWGGDGQDTLYGRDGNDKIWGDTGNDWLYGGKGNDSLWGGAGADSVFGEDGNDKIWGGTGGDHVDGGKGNDTISGGDGKDYLTGGAGKDTFSYFSTAELRVGSADVIMDFKEGDKIDLSQIDANLGAAGDQKFHMVAHDTGRPLKAGEMSVHYQNGNTIIEAGNDAYAGADMQIEMVGIHTLDSGDFKF